MTIVDALYKDITIFIILIASKVLFELKEMSETISKIESILKL